MWDGGGKDLWLGDTGKGLESWTLEVDRICQSDGSEQELGRNGPEPEIGGIRTPGGRSRVSPMLCLRE